MEFSFEIEVGMLSRSSIRQALQNSREKILHWYPGSKVLLTENKGLFKSEFYFEAVDLPDSAKERVEDWLNKLKQLSEKYN